MTGSRGFLGTLVTAFALLASPLSAPADFAINIVGPGAYIGAGITVLDNSLADLNPAVNQIAILAGAGGLPLIPGFTLSLNSALTNTPGGAPSSLVQMHSTLSSLFDVGGTVQVTASATGFTFPSNGTATSLHSAVAGTLVGDGSVSAQQWVDLTNILFGLGAITPGLQGPFTTAAFSNTASAGFTMLAGPFGYSITDRLNLTLGPNASTSDDLQSTVVPEPITMFLGGTGLLVLGYAARRRLFGR